MPRLTIRSENGKSVSHDLVEEAYTIGRSSENSIELHDTALFASVIALAAMKAPPGF